MTPWRVRKSAKLVKSMRSQLKAKMQVEVVENSLGKVAARNAYLPQPGVQL